MTENELLFSEVHIAVVGFARGKAREIVLTDEQRELVRIFIQSLGETVRMSDIELPLTHKRFEL